MSDVMANTISSALAAGAQVAEGEPKRLHWGPVSPPPVECTGCGYPVPYRDLAGDGTLWGRATLCYDDEPGVMSCLTKATTAVDAAYVASDRYVEERMKRSGLCKAEMGYDMAWMRERMEGIPFPGEVVNEHDRAHRPPWRYVHGKPGTGTSTQLALATRHYIARGKRCLFVTEAAMLASLLPKDKGSLVTRKTTGDFIAWDLLCIDKFGSWRTRNARENLGAILEARATRGKPTIFGSTVPIVRPKDAQDDTSAACIENHPIGGGALAALIAINVNGWRGICEMTRDHRPMPDMHAPSTFEQRLGDRKKPRTQHRGGYDPSPF